MLNVQGQDPTPSATRDLALGGLRTPAGVTLILRTPRGVLDVARAEAELGRGAPMTLDALIADPASRAALDALLAAVEAQPDPARFYLAEEDVVFGPPLTRPGKILCVGLNYRAHVEETNADLPPTPTLFTKFASSLNGHGGVIDVTRQNAVKFDFEAELVAVIGRRARNVSAKDALDHVFGYCCGNDFSARELQMATSQWTLGKAGDGWGPIGPWLIPAHRVDPAHLDIECLVNGEVRQSSNTARMIHSVAELIAFISNHLALEPGDLIFTGTPEGVILGQPAEQQVWLKAGDEVTTRITGLDALSFRLV